VSALQTGYFCLLSLSAIRIRMCFVRVALVVCQLDKDDVRSTCCKMAPHPLPGIYTPSYGLVGLQLIRRPLR